MQPFKVGDRVQCTQNGYTDLQLGQVYEVKWCDHERLQLKGMGSIKYLQSQFILHQQPEPITVYAVCDEKGTPYKGHGVFWDEDLANNKLDMLHHNGFTDTQVLPFTLTPSDPQH